MKLVYHLFMWAFCTQILFAQSPPNLTSNVTCSYSFSNAVATIAANYNCARNEEETQLGVVLPDITMPSQATWDAMSLNEKGLYLINQERTARGVSYGGTTPKALPLEGINGNLRNTAQSYADYLVSLNQFTHFASPAHPLGSGPFDRVANTPTVGGCSEFMNRSENIFATWGFSSMVNENAAIAYGIWLWNYQDAASSWGHREASLLQDYNLGGTPGNTYGYDDNFRSTGTEGFIGFGVKQGLGYRTTPDKYGIVVVMNIFDPVNNAGCDVALPINLLSFSAQNNGNTVQLNWRAGNPNATPFTVEQALVYWKDGQEQMEAFKAVDTISGDETGNFQFQINGLQNGTYAFRLKQGEFYSEIQKITVSEMPTELFVSIFPNPFQESLSIQTISPVAQELSITLYNALGQVVLTQDLGKTDAQQNVRFDIQTHTLSSGVYFAQIKGAPFSKMIKIVKP